MGDKTGVDVLALEQLIKTKSSIQIPKPVNDLDNKELEDIYGINRDTLMKIKRKKLKELKEFRVLKKQTLVKIYHIKNGDVDQLEGKKMKKAAEIDEDEDDVKEYDGMYGNGNGIRRHWDMMMMCCLMMMIRTQINKKDESKVVFFIVLAVVALCVLFSVMYCTF